MSDTAEFERKKWSEEVALRTRELNIREKEACAQRKASAKDKFWKDPLVLALIAAVVAAVANMGVAWKTGHDQRDVERNKAQAEREAEEAKAESDRILEVVKVNDPEKAAQNLHFLLDTWLIKDKERRDKIESYLKMRKGGQGVSGDASTPGQ
jgi:gas vesicle protein